MASSMRQPPRLRGLGLDHDLIPANSTVFEKISDRVTARSDAFQLKNGARIAAVIIAVQAHVQNDLASLHARRLAAGKDEIHELPEVRFLQAAHVRHVPLIELSGALRQGLQLPARRSTSWASPSISRKRMPGTSLSVASLRRRACRRTTLRCQVSSSSTEKTA